MVTDLDIYLFDLRGYLVIKNALDPEHIEEANAILDELRRIKPDGATAPETSPYFKCGWT